jgi:hypothetical protein
MEKSSPTAASSAAKEEHPEGSYHLYHKKNWIPVGADVLAAQRRRHAQLDNYEQKRLRGTAPQQSSAEPVCDCEPTVFLES